MIRFTGYRVIAEKQCVVHLPGIHMFEIKKLLTQQGLSRIKSDNEC